MAAKGLTQALAYCCFGLVLLLAYVEGEGVTETLLTVCSSGPGSYGLYRLSRAGALTSVGSLDADTSALLASLGGATDGFGIHVNTDGRLYLALSSNGMFGEGTLVRYFTTPLAADGTLTAVAGRFDIPFSSRMSFGLTGDCVSSSLANRNLVGKLYTAEGTNGFLTALDTNTFSSVPSTTLFKRALHLGYNAPLSRFTSVSLGAPFVFGSSGRAFLSEASLGGATTMSSLNAPTYTFSWPDGTEVSADGRTIYHVASASGTPTLLTLSRSPFNITSAVPIQLGGLSCGGLTLTPNPCPFKFTGSGAGGIGK